MVVVAQHAKGKKTVRSWWAERLYWKRRDRQKRRKGKKILRRFRFVRWRFFSLLLQIASWFTFAAHASMITLDMSFHQHAQIRRQHHCYHHLFFFQFTFPSDSFIRIDASINNYYYYNYYCWSRSQPYSRHIPVRLQQYTGDLFFFFVNGLVVCVCIIVLQKQFFASNSAF